jgi:hypothetical protein
MRATSSAAALAFLLITQPSFAQGGAERDVPVSSGGETIAASTPPPSPSHHYSAAKVRDVPIFGARLSMRLADARAALEKYGLRRAPFKPPARVLREAQILEADYVHPSKNTKVGLFYAVHPHGERRVSRIVLWEEIPVIGRTAFSQFLTKRYGAPTDITVFQGHDTYVWSQAPTDYISLLRSVRCLMPCLSSDLVGECSSSSISRQVFMSGGFNTNMPGKLYWTLDVNDLALQQNAMFGQNDFPRDRPMCPKPVV